MNQEIDSLKYYAAVLEDLHEVFKPHAGQVLVGKSLFYHGNSMAFLQCGRKFGKTCFSIYSLYRYALSFPGSSCYYFAPFLKQGAEILWHNGYMPRFLPDEMIKKYGIKQNNSEYRITFNNGSFIKVEGCDNVAAVAGINPHFVVLDELKDVKDSFWEIFEPNLLAHSAPILVVGSPPDNEDNLYVKLAKECRESPNKAYYKMSSFKNPHISHDWLRDKKQDLIKRGELEVWEREYMANIVFGGQKFIFPMLDEAIHVRPHADLIREVQDNYKKFDFYCSFDPGTTSCFAVLFIAVHRYTKRVYILDEIYEKDQAEATSKAIWKRASQKMRDIQVMDEDWMKIYDYAAAWFQNEIAMEFDEAIMPCTKDLKNKEMKLSLIKQLLVEELVVISDRCTYMWWEMRNYRKDDNGRIPKEDDHLLDNFRYILNAANYYSIPERLRESRTEWRGFRPEHDMNEIVEHDPFAHTVREYFETA